MRVTSRRGWRRPLACRRLVRIARTPRRTSRRRGPRRVRADPGGPRKVRAVKPKRTVVKPPAGDVASSGGDYGMGEAKRAERSAPVKRAQRAVYDSQPVK